MTDSLLANVIILLILVGLPCALVFRLFVAVKKVAHPSRSAFLAFAVTVAVVTAAMFVASIVIVALLTLFFGRNGNMGAAVTGLGVGGILGTGAAGWYWCKGWMSKPKQGWIAPSTIGEHRMTRD